MFSKNNINSDFKWINKDFFDFISFAKEIEIIAKNINKKLFKNSWNIINNNINDFYYEKFHDILSEEYKNNFVNFIKFSKYFYPSIYFYCYSAVYWEDKLIEEFDNFLISFNKNQKYIDEKDKEIYKEFKEIYKEEKNMWDLFLTINKYLDRLLFIIFLSDSKFDKEIIHNHFKIDDDLLYDNLKDNVILFKKVQYEAEKIIKKENKNINKEFLDKYNSYFNNVYNYIKENYNDTISVSRLYLHIWDYIKSKVKFENKKANIIRKTKIDLSNLVSQETELIDSVRKYFLNDDISYSNFFNEFLNIKNSILWEVILDNFYKLLTFNSEYTKKLKYEEWTEERSKIDFKLVDKDFIKLYKQILSLFSIDNNWLISPMLIFEVSKNINISKENFLILKYITIFWPEWWYSDFHKLFFFFNHLENYLFEEDIKSKFNKIFHLWNWWFFLSLLFIFLSYIYTKSIFLPIFIFLYLILYFYDNFTLKPLYRLNTLRYLVGVLIIITSILNETVINFFKFLT